MNNNVLRVGNFLVSDKDLIPRPEQVRKLAVTAMVVAQDAEAFRVPFTRKKVEPVVYWVDAKIHNSNAEMTDEFLRTSGMYTRRAASILADPENGAEYVGRYDDRWGMRYRELTQIADNKGRWTSGILSELSFEWDAHSVLLAEESVYEVPSVEAGDIDLAQQIVEAMIAEGQVQDAFAYSDTIPLNPTGRARHFVTRNRCAQLLSELRTRRLRPLDDESFAA